MARHRLSRWQRIAVLAMTGWGILTIAPDLLRPFWHYGTLGFEADNDGRVESVAETLTARPAGCIRQGDWLAMQPALVPSPGLLAVFGGMGGLQYVRDDQVISLRVSATREGPAHPCTVQATVMPPGKGNPLHDAKAWRFWAPILLEDLLGCIFIWVCARLLWQRPSPATWGFFLYGLWFNPGQYFAVYAELQRFPPALVLQEVAQSLFQAAGYVGFILFALCFPDRPLTPAWQPLYRRLPLIGALLAILQLASFASAFGVRTEKITDWSYLAGVAVDIGVWLILLSRYRDMSPIDRQRTRWVLWGCAVGLSAFIFADINEATSLFSRYWSPEENQLAWFYMINFVVVLAIYVAIRRYRVFDVHFRLSRWTSFLIAVGAVVVGLKAVELFIEDKYHDVMHLLPFGVLLTFGGELLREQMNEACNRLFFHRLHEARKHLEEIRARFDKAGDYDQVDALLIQEPVTRLGVASAAVFRKQGATGYRRLVAAVGWPDGTATEIPIDTPLVQILRQTRHFVRFDDESLVPGALPDSVAQPVLALPICDAEDLLAIALYGAHREGDNILREEIQILGSLIEAATMGYARSEANELRQELARLRHGFPAAGDPAI